MFMTDEQVGKYIRLLAAQHQNGGKLSEDHMIFICKSQDKVIWSKFEIDEDGYYYNVRLREETEKRSSYCKSRGDNKRGKVKSEDHKKIISKSYDNHMGNGNEDVNRDINKDGNHKFDIDPKFSKTWLAWIEYRSQIKKPIKPVSGKLAYENMVKIACNDPTTAEKIVNQSIANGWQGLFELKRPLPIHPTAVNFDQEYIDKYQSK
jgi:hypothetical protein